MDEAHPLSTPMVVRSLEVNKDPFRPPEEEEELIGPETPYLSAIGALMYLSNATRPDIAFSGTLDMSLFYANKGSAYLIGYVDASYLSDPYKARSQTGYVFTCGEKLVHVKSKSLYGRDLHNNKLTGPLPPQIGRLKRLKILNIRWNKLQDVIPPDIGELKQLTHFYLSFNNIKGEIPKELANLPELRYLHLHENHFAGRIPPELGTLQYLRHLYLNNNYLTGGIPAQLANLTNLKILYLSYNKMAGVIPASIAHIPKLTYLLVFLSIVLSTLLTLLLMTLQQFLS
ncbi:probable leucine-rich repeat receptor-like protein kinase At1g35710 [Nicotiana tomentosiformis]|uniref:probable leucine-rich repeat receptor-like protein kinase At1g35710 n=1 Tax=Nicotiana tomentosiformis TaxID=4098 RepID=UPI00388CACAC